MQRRAGTSAQHGDGATLLSQPKPIVSTASLLKAARFGRTSSPILTGLPYESRSGRESRLWEKTMMQNDQYQSLLSEISSFAQEAWSVNELQRFIVEAIPKALSHYHWVGFYMLDPSDPSMLELGPFRGAPTNHVRIPLTQGICGAAVANDDTILVDDVSADPRYLACSLETKSEIVVPVRSHGKAVGELDIDSHDLAAFTEDDREFLEQCAGIVGRFLER